MKKSAFVLSLVPLVFSFMVVSCKKTSTSATYSPTCNSIKSYTNDVRPIMQGNCASCHSSYSSYSQMCASASSIRSSIVSGSMPKGTTLTNAQKDNIVCWIDAGTPNN